MKVQGNKKGKKRKKSKRNEGERKNKEKEFVCVREEIKYICKMRKKIYEEKTRTMFKLTNPPKSFSS